MPKIRAVQQLQEISKVAPEHRYRTMDNDVIRIRLSQGVATELLRWSVGSDKVLMTLRSVEVIPLEIELHR